MEALILSSIALVVLVLLAVAALAFMLALASAVPWWVIVAYYAMRSVERSAHVVASAPKRMHLHVTRGDLLA